MNDLDGQIPKSKLLELIDDEGTGEINETNLQRVYTAISNATAEIDSYCNTTNTIPFNPVPTIIKKYAIDITIYNLFSRRGIDEESADKIISQRYKNAIAYFTNVAKGVVEVMPKNDTAQTPENEVSFSSASRLFTRDKMSGW